MNVSKCINNWLHCEWCVTLARIKSTNRSITLISASSNRWKNCWRANRIETVHRNYAIMHGNKILIRWCAAIICDERAWREKRRKEAEKHATEVQINCVCREYLRNLSTGRMHYWFGIACVHCRVIDMHLAVAFAINDILNFETAIWLDVPLYACQNVRPPPGSHLIPN